MRDLPFLVKPRLQPITETLGNEDIGQIKIERRGFLSVSEKVFLQHASFQEGITEGVLELVRKVGKEMSIGMEQANRIVLAALQGEPLADEHYDKVNSKYRKHLDSLTLRAMASEGQMTYIRALCMLIYRVDPEVDMEDLENLHPNLVEALATLCLEEEARSTAALTAALDLKDDGVDPDSFEALEKK